MPDSPIDKPHAAGFRTRLNHLGRPGTKIAGFVNPPLVRGSTVLAPSCAARRETGARRLEQVPVYGLYGTPTHYALEDVVADIEGGSRCQIVSSGLAAVTVALQAYLGAGAHLLMPDSVYGDTRDFCKHLLPRYGVDITYYDPTLSAEAMAGLMRDNTRVLFLESPGSHTFEVQDVPALAAVAHARGAKVILDNTWGVRHFQPFRHGVDVSAQALTKYIGGHSDLLLGGIITNSDADWKAIRNTAQVLGQYASPDDCWLALRGARTFAVRLAAQEKAGLAVATWLRARPEVLEVLHPALPGARGHDLWKRDFTGACSLFGVVFKPEYSLAAMHALIDSLALFGIGASWGGYESLALPSTGILTRTTGSGSFGGPFMRLHIGLEEVSDLIADLEQGLAVLRAHDRADRETP